MKNSLNNTPILKTVFAFYLMLIFCNTSINGQLGIKFNSQDAFKGYTLTTAEDIKITYLIDNCGKIVNTWESTLPEHYCRLTNEGNLLYIFANRIFEKNWNNNIVKNISINADDLRLDYEVMKLENGNFLAAARRIVNSSFYDQIGWSPGIPKPSRMDGVVEISPNGDVVWEWNIGDHTIQDKIASAPNYGNIKDHPELLDVNAISDADWQFGESFMINGIDYNPELDQIAISVRKMSEFMIIDHSTTTAEAKGSTGGNSGKGGDILYRWGNPQNYKQGTDNDQVLYYQHNPNWIKYGEHKGKIIVFNNGFTRDDPVFGKYSEVHIVDTQVENDGSYTIENNSPFAPAEADLTIGKATSGNNFFSEYTSGAQVLPNGNIYITVGWTSDFLEVKPNGNVVWAYAMPHANYIFRTEKYAKDFPGLAGKDLSGNGTIEFPSSTYNCEIFTSTKDIENQNLFSIRFNPLTNNLSILNLASLNNTLEIRNSQGQLIQSLSNVNFNTQISLENTPLGMYFVTLNDLNNSRVITHKILKY